jgi:RNA-directed DNA polymerase
MLEVCERENCKQALRRVRANKGSPGVDAISVHKLARVEPPDEAVC